MPKTPNLSPIGKLCHKAADLIEKHGWTQNHLVTPDGKICLRGALNMARNGAPDNWMDDSTLAKVERVMGFAPSMAPGNAVAWNNAKSRRKSQVLARLRAVR